MKRIYILLALFLPLHSPPLRGEEPVSPLLDDALDYIKHGEYRAAAYELERLLYPLAFKGKKDIVQAKFLLGECYLFLGEEEKAGKEFLSLLKLMPQFEPDPLYTPASVIRFFHDTRERHRKEIQKYIDLQKELMRLPHGEIEEPIQVSTLSYLLHFVPPAGQFRNRHYLKGVEIALLLIVSGVANLYSYNWLVNYQDEGYPEEKKANAGGMRTINFLSFGILVSTYIYGSSDGIYFQLRSRKGALNGRGEFSEK